MKTLSKKLVISILTLVFAVVSFGSTTFAWFTISGKAEVSTITATVETPIGLEVRVGEEGEWKTGYLDLGTTYNKGAIKPVSYTKGIASLADTAYDDNGFSILAQKVNRATAYEPANDGDYVKLVLQFRTTQPGKLYLSADTTLKGTTAEELGTYTNWAVDKAYTLVNADGTAGSMATVDNEDSAKSSQIKKYAPAAARLMTVSTGKTTIFEKEAKTTNDGAIVNTIGLNASGDTFGALGYYKAKTGLTINPTAPTYSDVVQLKEENMEDTLIHTINEADDGQGYRICTVTVFLWMEGFDKDCLNAQFAGQLNLSLMFKFAQE